MDPTTVHFADGSIASGEQSRKPTDLVGAGMDADSEIRPGSNNKNFSQQSYGAHFAEVGVDEDTGEVRLRRMLGLNPSREANRPILAFSEIAANQAVMRNADRSGLTGNAGLSMSPDARHVARSRDPPLRHRRSQAKVGFRISKLRIARLSGAA
jgi:hypothetical protein